MAFLRENKTLGQSERYRKATQAELYHLGHQYDSLAEWGDKSKPLRQRKPLVQIPLYSDAIATLDRFIWGGSRFPKVVVGATRKEDEPESKLEIGPRLDTEQAALLTDFAQRMIASGRLHRAIREASRVALVTTSAAVILGSRGGYLSTHVEVGKHCTPTFRDDNPHALAQLEIVYQHEREDPQHGGVIGTGMWWYRRVIDAEMDTVFREVPVFQGQEPKWEPDEDKTFKHGLGFCPAVWIRTAPDSTDPVDGRPVIDPQLYPLIDDCNYIVSQRSRAVSYGCDPQPIRTGVDEADREALNKSPGVVWDLPDNGGLKFAEIEGTGSQRATEHLEDMVARFREAVGVVKADPKTTSGNISGVVLEFLHAPMIALASDLRFDLGDDGYCNLLNLALRFCSAIVGRGEDVWIPGIGQAADTLAHAQLGGVWLDVPISIAWPSFFPPTAQDQVQIVDMTNKAVQGKLVSQVTGTRKVAEIFDVEDAEAEQEAIEEEGHDSYEAPIGETETDKPEAGAVPEVPEDPKVALVTETTTPAAPSEPGQQ